MTPLELARDLWAGLEHFESEEIAKHVVRALCTQAAVDETRRSAESDQDYMDGLAAMEWIKKRADELYTQIVRE